MWIQGWGQVLITKISYDYCDITGFYTIIDSLMYATDLPGLN